MISTRFTARFGIDHPIALAPMALASGGRLAGAVADAGGLGFIGGGYGDEAWLETEFQAAGNRAVGCGFITWSLAKQPRLLAAALARKPPAIMLSFGDPLPYAGAIHEQGAALFCQVQTLDHAREAIAAGAEAIVAQGTEAGGHGGNRATLTLVPEIADLLAARAPKTLLLAAGGIADGRGLAAALMLGADGVLMGSRFWASEEALVHDSFQRAALAADGDATLRTRVPDIARGLDWPKAFTVRGLRNKFTDQWHGREDALLEVAEREAARYAAAAKSGDPDIAGVLVGEAAGLIADIPPAAELLTRISAEAETLLASKAPGLVSG